MVLTMKTGHGKFMVILNIYIVSLWSDQSSRIDAAMQVGGEGVCVCVCVCVFGFF